MRLFPAPPLKLANSKNKDSPKRYLNRRRNDPSKSYPSSKPLLHDSIREHIDKHVARVHGQASSAACRGYVLLASLNDPIRLILTSDVSLD